MKQSNGFGKGLKIAILVVALLFIFGDYAIDYLGIGTTDTTTQSEKYDAGLSTTESVTETGESLTTGSAVTPTFTFRSEDLLKEHYEKHGSDFNYTSAQEYEAGASAVITSDAAIHKTEAEDGDAVYYIQSTNEFVILSTDGYIRTYFKPEDGIEYYNRQ